MTPESPQPDGGERLVAPYALRQEAEYLRGLAAQGTPVNATASYLQDAADMLEADARRIADLEKESARMYAKLDDVVPRLGQERLTNEAAASRIQALEADLAARTEELEKARDENEHHKWELERWTQYAERAEADIRQLREHILDIAAHATPYGDIPDEPGWVGTYLVTAGALHRALGKVGHSAPSCAAEAQLQQLREAVQNVPCLDPLERFNGYTNTLTKGIDCGECYVCVTLRAAISTSETPTQGDQS